MKPAKSILGLFTFSLIGAGCTFITGVLLANTLGDAGYGAFSSSLSLIVVIATFASFGAGGFWLKIFGEEGWGALRWVTKTFKLSIIAACVGAACIFGWAVLGPNEKIGSQVLLILTVCIFSQIAIGLTSSKLQLEERFMQLATWELLQPATRLLLVLMFIFLLGQQFTIVTAAGAFAVVGLLTLCIGCWQLRNMSKGKLSLQGHGNRGVIKALPSATSPRPLKLFLNIWPFGLAGISYVIYYQSDIVLLRYMVNKESAGVYSVAFMMIALVCIFPNVVYQKYLLPKLHRWSNFEKDRIYRLYKLGNVCMFFIGVFVSLVLWFSSSFILFFFFGEQYGESRGILLVLLFVIPFRFVTTNTGALLTTKNNMSKKAIFMCGTALLNVVLNILLIPTLTMKGAALSTVCCEALLAIVFCIYVTKNKTTMFVHTPQHNRNN
ncbi:MAG: O-antigen/teichoic acid export membrane protein [Phycisphaerales bacterium]|jgi:O-antigen/teichoic acid export membrane protein